jgi:hypothetical protein
MIRIIGDNPPSFWVEETERTNTMQSQPLIDLANDPMVAPVQNGAVSPHGLCRCGARLYEVLAGNSTVGEELREALRINGNTTRPLFLGIGSNKAESLPWELLHPPWVDAAAPAEPHDGIPCFLNLDRRWPVIRTPITAAGRSRDKVRSYPGQLRIAVVLAATKLQDGFPGAIGEWTAFTNALKLTTEKIRLLVFTCQPKLVAVIEKAIKTSANFRGRVDLDGPHELKKEVDLRTRLKDFGAHILHFFCHGFASPAGGVLHLASVDDWERESGDSSIDFAIEDFRDIQTLDNPWLAVLNCCEGAKPTGAGASLARMVVQNGLPAAVGMRRTVGHLAVHTFTKALYSNLLLYLGEKLEGLTDAEVEIDWSPILREPRRSLVQHSQDLQNPPLPSLAVPCGRQEWSLPVLYVRQEPFLVRRSLVRR